MLHPFLAKPVFPSAGSAYFLPTNFPEEPFFLILDGHPVHRSKKVKVYVDRAKGKLRIFMLPPYSPHLNPDEWVWNWLKKHNLGRAHVTGPDQFRELVHHFMRRLQKLTHVLSGFFRDPNLSYING
jgi:transposase